MTSVARGGLCNTVFCLQEVDRYDDVFEKELKDMGFGIVYGLRGEGVINGKGGTVKGGTAKGGTAHGDKSLRTGHQKNGSVGGSQSSSSHLRDRVLIAYSLESYSLVSSTVIDLDDLATDRCNGRRFRRNNVAVAAALKHTRSRKVRRRRRRRRRTTRKRRRSRRRC